MTDLINEIEKAIKLEAEKYQEGAQGYDVLDGAFIDGARFILPLLKRALEQRDVNGKHLIDNYFESHVFIKDNADLLKLLGSEK